MSEVGIVKVEHRCPDAARRASSPNPPDWFAHIGSHRRVLPRVGLGCMRLSTEPRPRDQAVALLHAALDRGLRLFDTATAYCAHDALGENERLLREALTTHALGPEAVIVTKAGLRRPAGAWRPDGRRGSILEDAERSCEALGRVPDVLLLHAVDPSVPFATSVRALEEARARGLTKAIGLSNVTVGQLAEARALAPITVVQQGYSVFDERARTSGVLAACAAQGLWVMAHTPLGGPKRIGRLGASEALRAVAARQGLSPSGAALAALLDAQPRLSVIPGTSRVERLDELARLAAVHLAESERHQLRASFSAIGPPVAVEPTSGARPEVVLLMGLQGAGKSHLVDRYVSEGFVRFNRDSSGGTIKDLALAMSRALASGTTHVVLDNTATTRATRAPVIEQAKKHGAKVRGVWLDVPLHEAQVNVIRRMLAAHGRLLGPEELKAQRDNTGLTPVAHFRTLRELELPTKEEGFDVLETRPFVREPSEGRAGRFVALEVAQQVEPSEVPTFVVAWAETGADAVRAAASRLGAQALICPHGGGPPVCWCRPPLPGLLLEACHRHGLSPQRCEVIGVTETHQMLAATVGATFSAPTGGGSP
ncbi:MAG: aldo/keto reductase [Myxococcaceae bacterium]|nr:aldo/keto reductase [Myxococcaceae bacterium]